MKEPVRSRWTMISQDIVLSFQDARWGLGVGALLFFAAAMVYQTSLGPAENVQTIPMLSDYITFAFAGSYPFINGSGAPFTLPITWFTLIFFCIHTCALFPYRMMRGMGVGRLLQTGSRLKWWCRLSVLVIFWCAAYMLMGLLCMGMIGVVRYGACQMGAIPVNLIGAVFLTLCVLAELQAVCSALASPLIGELLNAALMVWAAFWNHPALWPRYSMLLRSSAFAMDGFSPVWASAYLLASFLAVFGVGAALFQKSSILSHSKGR